MHAIEIEQVLDSMQILVDTREQPSKRAEKRYNAFKHTYIRQKLDFGDYGAQLTLLDGSQAIIPAVIERKMSLDELAGCFTRDRDRFKREFERAQSSGAKVYLLVENATWENLILGRYRSKFNPIAYLASITAWMARYNISTIFCKEETSGKLIDEILYREAKERLERGEYG